MHRLARAYSLPLVPNLNFMCTAAEQFSVLTQSARLAVL